MLFVSQQATLIQAHYTSVVIGLENGAGRDRLGL